MTEKKFLNCILIDGILLISLGIAMLLLPKITTIAFGLILSISLVLYGLYKIFNAIVIRNYSKHFMLNITGGILLTLSGTLLWMSPTFSLMFITALIGMYFIIESISSIAFSLQTKNLFSIWWVNIFVALLQFLLGIIIIIALPSTALWVVGILIGINFLCAGIVMTTLYVASQYTV